jgi:hypothetical protein
LGIISSGIFVINLKSGQWQNATSRPTLASFESLPGAPSIAISCFGVFAMSRVSS